MRPLQIRNYERTDTMSNGKKTLVQILTLTLLATMFICSATLAAENAAQDENSLLFKDLVGSWQGSNDVGVNFLLSFTRSKTYTVTFAIPGVGAAHGHGAWKRTGLKAFESTDVAYVLNPNDGSINLIQTTQASFTINAGNDTVDIDLAVNLSLPDGTPVDAFTSFATAERIKVIPFP